jgi:hypothetical protein
VVDQRVLSRGVVLPGPIPEWHVLPGKIGPCIARIRPDHDMTYGAPRSFAISPMEPTSRGLRGTLMARPEPSGFDRTAVLLLVYRLTQQHVVLRQLQPAQRGGPAESDPGLGLRLNVICLC